MPRTAHPTAPGETPKADAFQAHGTILGDDEAAKIDEALTSAAVTETVLTDENKDLAAIVAELARQMKALQAENARLAANQRVIASSGVKEPVKLPTMKEALANGKPDIPVLTDEGWYVPPVMPGILARS